VPEQAFFLIGGLDDLAKKAESFGASLDGGNKGGAKKSGDAKKDDAGDE
jgi:F-type H+/Na+-transporting ATPase subunit beta